MGTLGKALGSYGAYVCRLGRADEYLVNVGAALHLLDRPAALRWSPRPSGTLALLAERPGRVERLASNAGGPAPRAWPKRAWPSIPRGRRSCRVMVGGAEEAMALCERALEQGVFAQAIRPPTVPKGTSRLRMTAMATHRVGDAPPRREA